MAYKRQLEKAIKNVQEKQDMTRRTDAINYLCQKYGLAYSSMYRVLRGEELTQKRPVETVEKIIAELA